MTSKRSLFLGAACGLALIGAGCGDDDNDTLSYDDTGTEIGEICDSVNFDGLTGKPANDAEVIARIIPDFQDAVQQVRDLDVNEELAEIRDEFADNADQQVALLEDAQAAAEEGNAKEYRETFEGIEPLGKQSDELASQLGATGCIES